VREKGELYLANPKMGIPDAKLNSMNLTIHDKEYIVNFNDQDIEKEIEMSTFAMDFSYMSRSMASVQSQMVRYYLIEKKRKELNQLVDKLLPLSEMKGVSGRQRSPKDLLRLLIPVYQLPNEKVKIKISGDGRRCGKKRNQVMMTLSVVSAGAVSTSPDHHFTLALWEGKEDYDTFSLCLASLLAELREIQEQGIDTEQGNRSVELFLSGDWKFLAIVLGLNSASSEDFCLWCKAKKGDLGVKEFFESRKMEEVLDYFSGCSKKEIPGQDRRPLFDFIPFSRVIVDPLHAFLRISDKLISLMIEEALELEGYVCGTCSTKKGKRKCRDGCECDCHISSQEAIEKEMERIGIRHFYFFQGKDGKGTDWTSLQGDDKSEILKKFNLEAILSPERAQLVGQLWSDYLIINRSLHASVEILMGQECPTSQDEPGVIRGKGKVLTLKEFPAAVKKWNSDYLLPSSKSNNQVIRGLYQRSDITPYLHALCSHLPSMLHQCISDGLSLEWFSASGLEKKNHLQVNFFHAKTFKGGKESGEAEKAIMMAEGRRILFMKDHFQELQKNGFQFKEILKLPKPTQVNLKSY